MGYQTIIIVLLSSTLLSVTILGLSGVWDQSTTTVVTQANEEQAVNVASSGVNLAIISLRRNKDWRTGFSSLPVAGGRCTVSLTDLGVDSVRITSNGTINGTTHTSIAVVKLASIFPSVEAALTVTVTVLVPLTPVEEVALSAMVCVPTERADVENDAEDALRVLSVDAEEGAGGSAAREAPPRDGRIPENFEPREEFGADGRDIVRVGLNRDCPRLSEFG